jgi:hypothetical protein
MNYKIKLTLVSIIISFFVFTESVLAYQGEDCTKQGGKCNHNWVSSNCTSQETDLGYLDCLSGSCCKSNSPTPTPTPTPTATAGNTSGGSFAYTPMEKIPGFESVGGDFPQYILAVYRFGLWTIGIAALLMIMIGGFMYITSAGNNAAMGKAKGVITDAIIGLILALCSYLLLWTINPELLQIKKLSTSGNNNANNSDAKAQEDCRNYWNAYYANNPSDPDLKKQLDNCNTVTAAQQNAQIQEDCRNYWNAYYVNNPSDPELQKQLTNCNNVAAAQQQNFGNANCSNLNSSLNSELANASNASGVPPSILAAFLKRECPAAMSNPSACGTNHGGTKSDATVGGPMQFTDKTWNDSRFGCTGSKFNRQDALNCAANKIKVDSGGDYSEAGIRKAAQKYCGSCTDVEMCGGDYCDRIVGNYNVYKNGCTS